MNNNSFVCKVMCVAIQGHFHLPHLQGVGFTGQYWVTSNIRWVNLIILPMDYYKRYLRLLGGASEDIHWIPGTKSAPVKMGA